MSLSASRPPRTAKSPTRRLADENADLPGPGEKRSRRPSPTKQAAPSRQRARLSPSRLTTNLSAAAAGVDSPAAHEGDADCTLRGAGGLVASSAPANGEWVASACGGWRQGPDPDTTRAIRHSSPLPSALLSLLSAPLCSAPLRSAPLRSSPLLSSPLLSSPLFFSPLLSGRYLSAN